MDVQHRVVDVLLLESFLDGPIALENVQSLFAGHRRAAWGVGLAVLGRGFLVADVLRTLSELGLLVRAAVACSIIVPVQA